MCLRGPESKFIGYDYVTILQQLPLVSRCGLCIRPKQASRIALVNALIAYVPNTSAAPSRMRKLGTDSAYDDKCVCCGKQERMMPKPSSTGATLPKVSMTDCRCTQLIFSGFLLQASKERPFAATRLTPQYGNRGEAAFIPAHITHPQR